MRFGKSSSLSRFRLPVPPEIPCLPNSVNSVNSRRHSGCHYLLPQCGNLKSVLQIHAGLIVSCQKSDNYGATHLIHSYSSIFKTDSARYFLNSIDNPPLSAWNSMIRVYIRSRQYDEALKLYRHLLEKGVLPDKYTYTFVLKACTGAMNVEAGVMVHNEVVRRKLEKDLFIGTGLIDMYCKFGILRRALEVFDNMPEKDITTWNALIAGLAKTAEPNEALRLFRTMQIEGLEPNSVSLLNVFPAVCKLLDVGLCKAIHGYIIRRQFCPAVSNGLVDVYSKCGCADFARLVFDRMWGRDDVSWGTMMAGYAFNGCFEEVFELFDQLKGGNLKMNKVSVVSALLAAAELEDLKKGKDIHDFVVLHGLDSDVLIATPLVAMYAKCGEPQKAEEFFRRIQGKDLVAWSAVIAALIQSGYPEEGLALFKEMLNENLKPNRITLMSLFPACSELSYLNLGKSLHSYAIKTHTDSDTSLGTALVSMYAKCGCFCLALLVFNSLPCKEIVTWNALINGYAQIGEPSRAMEFFNKLKLSGEHPDAGTLVGLVVASSFLNDLSQGRSAHGQIIKSGFESGSHLVNTLIDMYAKCGNLSSSVLVFDKTEFTKDVISWNILIAGYMQNGRAEEAISTFYQMKLRNLRPTPVTIVSILPAVARLAALKQGMILHAYALEKGFLANTMVGNSLVDMYAKCGRVDYAKKCFTEIRMKDAVSWNAMVAGYAVNGHARKAIELFSVMQECRVRVDSTSFISALSACRHAGLVEEGRKIFYSMGGKDEPGPDIEHYACMVDLLGRAGLFDEILCLIERMPMEPDAGVWGALLNACRLHSNVKLGEVALGHLVELEPRNPAHYVVLSGIYADSGRWRDAGDARSKMKASGLKKTPGYSWKHEFLAERFS